ncbi:MAG: efflux RND transporter periplasmic adaptor subunit [Pseudomonadota bacterium]
MKTCAHFAVIAVTLLCVPILSLAQGGNRAAPVSVVQVASASVHEEIPLTGSVNARRTSMISPKVAGLIAEVLIDDGYDVKTGEPLFRLDSVIADISVARARAELAEADARLKDAKRQRDEAQELVAKKHIPASNYESALAQVEISAAAVQRLSAELNRQEELLRRHTVYAPFDGVIAKKLVEVGQWVQTGTAVTELVELDVLRIEVPVPQFYFSKVQPDMPVSIQYDALPGQIFEGKVSMKIAVGQTSARTFPVRIDIDNKARIIAPGMSARVRLQVFQSDVGESMLLPSDAFIRRPDGATLVWRVVEKDGTLSALPTPVKTGRGYRKYTEVTSQQLKVGDKVVVRGNELLRPNQAVRIIEEINMEL